MFWGTTGETNVQGEVVKSWTRSPTTHSSGVFEHSGLVCALASSGKSRSTCRNEGPRQVHAPVRSADGSSNTDVNMQARSFPCTTQGWAEVPGDDDLLRQGVEQVAAGYLLYGSSTMLVFTVGQGVHGFTLEPSIGEYLLSHENIRIPKRGKVYAANEGNYHRWPAGTQKYVDHVKEKDKATGRPYSGRYCGCLVADVHRILLGGGIYLYPGESDKPEGKLRLLYEGNPLALVVEQAGGKATTGTMRILEVEPKALHQRVPLVIGSSDDVDQAEAFIQGRV
ncbi:MAG: class 1 fructose-bisphosphatase [Nitrospiraceae bacterium]